MVSSTMNRRFIVVSSFYRGFIVVSWWFHRKTEKKYKFTTFGRISSVQLTLHCVNMSLKQGRTCPVCLKENLFYLGDHLRQVHQLSGAEKKNLLKSAVFSPTTSRGLPYMSPYPFWGMPQYTMNAPLLAPSMENSNTIQTPNLSQSMKPKQRKVDKLPTTNCLETQPYPEFKFNHMFSMLVVGPTQCGKTYFVQQLLTKNCIEYPSEKSTQVYWFYNQWQPRYDALKRALKKKIQFTQGLPDLSEDLHEINPEYNNILVFDDLMSQAIDSPVLSQLFTQGRHRNASVILLLQNMFPKGKYNTDINRNAQYVVLFRSPSDRKQIDIFAERTFAKDRKNFMSAYAKETAKPYGYVMIDNQPKTTSEKQVIADVFGVCKRYPHISTQSEITQTTTEVQPKPSVTCKVECPLPKQPVKRKTQREKPPAKRKRTEGEQTKPVKPYAKKVKTLPKTQTKSTVKRSRKPAVYKAKAIRESSEDIYSNEEEERRDFRDELNKLATQDYLARQSRSGFSYNPSYE